MTIDASLDKRLRRIVRTHDRMNRNGVVHRVGKDGLIRSRARLMRPRFPLKGAVAIVAIFLMFKALLFAQMGAGLYNGQVEALRTGTLIERAGAVLMQQEPVTVTLARYLSPYISKP